jgi:methenyltetrahydromethanopterin cyclohydrolase
MRFNYTDPFEDLYHGHAYLRYNGTEYEAATLAGEFIGKSSGTAILYLSSITLNSTVGTVPVSVWIADNGGNKSNEVAFNINQVSSLCASILCPASKGY